MPIIFKIVVIIIMLIILAVIGYIIYLYIQDRKEEIENTEKTQLTKISISHENKITESQKEKLIEIVKKRLSRLQNVDTLDSNELEVLSKIIEKKDFLVDWNKLIEITKNEKAYGILNIAVFDYLYSIITKKEKEEEVIKTIYLLDCLNGGVGIKKGELDCLPAKLDITATLINILNKAIGTNKVMSDSTIKRACIDLASNGGYKFLNWPAKQVIVRVILDNLADTVYNYKNTTILSDENKIYLRLLAVVLSGKEYKEIVKENI